MTIECVMRILRALDTQCAIMNKRNTKPHQTNGRIKKTVEFEVPVYRKAEQILRHDKRLPKATLKTILSESIEAEHARRFVTGSAK